MSCHSGAIQKPNRCDNWTLDALHYTLDGLKSNENVGSTHQHNSLLITEENSCTCMRVDLHCGDML